MTEAIERMLPLYEAKMIHQFDQRWATYEPDGSVRDVTPAEKENPAFTTLSRYWVREEVVRDRLSNRWGQNWLFAWRRIARSTDERTFISTLLPRVAAGDSLFLGLPHNVSDGWCFVALTSSFAFDYVFRQKTGGVNASFFLVEQLPIPEPTQLLAHAPTDETWEQFLRSRSRAASSLGIDVEQRDAIRAEIDAACFVLYGITRADADYIMDTFLIVKRKEEATLGSYVTKERVLAAYDEMQIAIDSGELYESPLEPELSRFARVTAEE